MRYLISLFFIFSNIYASQITGVNFIQEGEVSKLIISLDSPAFAERKHIKSDKQIILDVKNVRASKRVLRAIDTSEFEGASVYIAGYQKPGQKEDVRFAIQLRDNVRSVLDTEKNKIVLSIENRFGVFSKNKIDSSGSIGRSKVTNKFKSADSEKIHIPKSHRIEDILENLTMSGTKKYIGKKISINVRDISLVDLLSMISEVSGFNIIIDESAKSVAPITLSLTNIAWDHALDTVFGLTKLVSERTGNILTVLSKEKSREKFLNEQEAKQAKLKLEPLVTNIFPISFAEISSIQSILGDYLTKERGTIKIDSRTNQLIIRDTVLVMEKVKDVIEALDTQTPQILIEAKIVEAQENYARQIGLSNGINFGYDPISPVGTSEGPGFSFSSAPSGDSPGVFSATIGVFNRLLDLNFQLDIMESESKVKVVSSPKVITENKKAATITNSQSTSFAQRTTAQDGTVTTGFANVSANINLTVTPQITNEGSILMSVQVSKSGFGTRPSDGAPPDTTSNNVNTNVLVDNGSTVVIGGVYSQSELENENGIPFLKDLPLIGWLFRSPDVIEKTKSEMIVFLTPRIINQEKAGLVEGYKSL